MAASSAGKSQKTGGRRSGGGGSGGAVVRDRVIMLLDLDCFYAQVKILLNPALAGQAVGVTQKNLVVTCNYEARALGVEKMSSITSAIEKCPSLKLVNGEDLTDFRKASEQVEAILCEYTPLTERRGFDEFHCDITALVQRRLQSGKPLPTEWSGHVFRGGKHKASHAPAVVAAQIRMENEIQGVSAAADSGSTAAAAAADSSGVDSNAVTWTVDTGDGDDDDSGDRFFDDDDGRADGAGVDDYDGGNVAAGGDAGFDPSEDDDSSRRFRVHDFDGDSDDAAIADDSQFITEAVTEGVSAAPLASSSTAAAAAGGGGGGGGVGEMDRTEVMLMIGSHISAEIRAAIKSRLHFNTCVGIGHNKILSKFAADFHKPDQQTTFLPSAAPSYLVELPVRHLPGIGSKLARDLLQKFNVKTAGELQRIERSVLNAEFGVRIAELMYDLCRGHDSGAPVASKGAMKTTSVEDTFAHCASGAEVWRRTVGLATHLYHRLQRDTSKHKRRANALVLTTFFSIPVVTPDWHRISRRCAMPREVWLGGSPQAVEAGVQAMTAAAFALFRKLAISVQPATAAAPAPPASSSSSSSWLILPPFNITLLNLGATDFKLISASDRTTENAITSFFGRKSPAAATAGATASAAPTPAAAIPPPPSIATSVPAAKPHSPATAAAASTAAAAFASTTPLPAAAATAKRKAASPPTAASATTAAGASAGAAGGAAISFTRSDVDPEFLAALPLELRAEVLLHANGRPAAGGASGPSASGSNKKLKSTASAGISTFFKHKPAAAPAPTAHKLKK